MIRYRIALILILLGLVKTVDAQNDGMFKAPERGFTSSEPAKTEAHALISGNGTMGALVLGQPHEEKVILSQSDLLIPAFDLHVLQESANVKHYQRSVNFETGEALVNWSDEKGNFERRVFVSRADSVIVVSIKGDAKINIALDFAPRPILENQREFVNGGIEEMKAGAENGWLSFQCKFNHYMDGLQGYEGLGRVILRGGKSEVVGNKLQISGADEVLLLIQIQSSTNWSKSLITEMKTRLAAITSSYTELRDKHAAIHSKIFNRSRLILSSNPADRALNTEMLLQKGESEMPTALLGKLYDAGRYNLLSTMGSTPPNASVLSSNMPELMEGYFRYMENQLPAFRENARRLYGVSGIHIPAHRNGAADRTADFFYDYYQYTQDRTFLKARAYPFMKEAAQFYEEFLTPGGEEKSQAEVNAHIDVMIARQLLSNCIAAAKTLALDAPKVKIWTDMLSKMSAYEVAADSTSVESFDNAGYFFNTDINDELPAVILEKLVSSEQDMIKLLPALPKTWNKGRLEGALLRGNINLKSLEWDNKQVKLTLNTKVRRTQTLVFPAEVERLLINGFSISINRIKDRKFLLNLAQAKDVYLEIIFK